MITKKTLFLTLLIIGFCYLHLYHVTAVEKTADARTLLDQAFGFTNEEQNWASKDLENILNKILADYPNSAEALTAKNLLIGCLLSRQEKLQLDRAQSLCEELIKDPASSWHGHIARFDLVTLHQLRPNYKEAIVAAKEALLKIDFQLIEKSSDKDLKALRTVIQSKPYGMRETIKAVLALSYARTHQLNEADRIFATISDKELAADVVKEINYLKKIPEMKKMEEENTKKRDEERRRREEAGRKTEEEADKKRHEEERKAEEEVLKKK